MENLKLTDEQIDQIGKEIDESYNRKDIETPDKKGEFKNVKVIVDPNTGEHVISPTDEDVEMVTFEEMANKINEGSPIIDSTPFTEKEIMETLSEENSEIMMNEDGTGLSIEDIRAILKIANRRLKGEKFNVYKEFPKSIQNSIDEYVITCNIYRGVSTTSTAYLNGIKNRVAEAIIDSHAQNIKMKRAKHDFAQELANVYNTIDPSIEDSDKTIDEKNKSYRNYINQIDNDDMKNKLSSILDSIDSARNLDTLKEFAKGCKIKSIEIEKYESRVFSDFLYKYLNSSNNIYDINLAFTVIARHIMPLGYTEKDVLAFLIAFCKYTKTFSTSVPTEHAYMYFVLYYCTMADNDTSDIFKKNVCEVIDILRKRNNKPYF